MDLQNIVHLVAQLIGPVLPDLVKGNLEAIATALGMDVYEKVKDVWAKVKNAFESDDHLKPIAQLARSGAKANYTDLIEQKLGVYLEANPEILRELVKKERVIQHIIATKKGEIERARNENTSGTPAEQVIHAGDEGKIRDGVNKIGGEPPKKA